MLQVPLANCMLGNGRERIIVGLKTRWCPRSAESRLVVGNKDVCLSARSRRRLDCCRITGHSIQFGEFCNVYLNPLP
jgi:hypothetical protein